MPPSIQMQLSSTSGWQEAIWHLKKKKEEGEEEKIAQSHSLVVNFSLIKEFLHFIIQISKSKYLKNELAAEI